MLKVGELARKTGKTVRALRFYEELGLLRPKTRTEGGFRLYASDDVRRVEVVCQLQELGLSLEDIAGIVRAWQKSRRSPEETERLREKLESAHRQAHEKIEKLLALAREFEVALGFLAIGDGRGQVPAFMDRLTSPE